MVDFADLLKKKVDDVKAPPTLPAGTYNGMVQKFEFKTSRDKGYAFVDFSIRLLSPGDDIEASDMEGIDLSQRVVHKSFFFDQEGLEWAARQEVELSTFIKSCGIATAGRSLGETIPESINASVLVKISHRLNEKNPEQPFVDVAELVGAP